MLDLPPIVIFSLGFLIIAFAAKLIGKYFSEFGLPYITGYLLTGAVAGPFILELLPKEASETLRYIDDISLAVIAFIAGSELYLKELRSRLRNIALNTTGIVITAFIMIGTALYFVQSLIPFTADYPPITKIAVALLGATILLALSPASTIAVIQEVRARGPFSKTVLSITVVMDVVIIVMFAISVAFASAMIDGSSVTVGFVVILVIDIIIALVAGYLVGQAIAFLFSTAAPDIAKAAILLVLSFLLFESAQYIPVWVYDAIGVKIKIEPLLMSMVAGFTVTNFTQYRQPFEDLLHKISPWVYVAFFTLTGVGLKLDILIETIGIATILFLVRMVAIVIGTYIGGTIVREEDNFKRYAGLGLITQAGIALGLARETAVIFPDTLGGEFATLVISVVVLNEIFGPMLLKFALRRVGEAYVPAGVDAGAPRRLLILGAEPQSVALARQMRARDWEVTLVDTDKERIDTLNEADLNERLIDTIDEDMICSILSSERDAIVAMLDDDSANMAACQCAHDALGVKSIVVRLRDARLRDQFLAIGARVLDPASAMVHLLEQSIVAPEAVNVLLHQDPDYDVVQATITDKAFDGIPLRDLRLPVDVLVLEIIRDGHMIVPHGFSKLRINDELTMIGTPKSLSEVTLKLGY